MTEDDDQTVGVSLIEEDTSTVQIGKKSGWDSDTELETESQIQSEEDQEEEEEEQIVQEDLPQVQIIEQPKVPDVKPIKPEDRIRMFS